MEFELENKVAYAPLYASPLERRVVFFLVFMGVFSLTYGLFFIIDFLPQAPGSSNAKNAPVAVETKQQLVATTTARAATTTTTTTTTTVGHPTTVGTPTSEQTSAQSQTQMNSGVDPYPKQIIFDSLNNKTVKILNPESRSIAALDTALLSGVIRYPDSADFSRTGTIFLLGHSSYLPNVINKNFQAFNGIQKLAWGDVIRLRSSDTEYVYRVDRVYQAKAAEAEIKIETGQAKLTLATCNSFGSKDDRFIVEATLVEQKALPS